MKNTFIIFDALPGKEPVDALIFEDPDRMIVCDDAGDVECMLDSVDAAISGGAYVAGFLSYELGYCFLDIPFKKQSELPFFSFGVFSSPHRVPIKDLPSHLGAVPGEKTFSLSNGYYSTPFASYIKDFAAIKKNLEQGNTYQVNYTLKYKFDFTGQAGSLFTSLLARQEVPFGGFIELDRWAILSLSPELFFTRNGNEICVRPMKGTIARGNSKEEDLSNLSLLKNSSKDRAENIMIVDLLRSDLGRIAESGSVRPRNLFTIEKYRTLFQMTSTISSVIRDNVSWRTLFSEIFPSGSVTGAPKKRTMEIIRSLEKEDRNIYTGSIGYVSPNGKALFNVAIRTLLLDKKTSRGEMGIGSGLVYDSQPKKEYEECLLKGEFLTGICSTHTFSLIETMLLEKGQLFLLDLHLNRLAKSALFFSFPLIRSDIASRLEESIAPCDTSKKYRVRLLLDNTGSVEISITQIDDPSSGVVNAIISEHRTNPNNIFLRHKTTNRSFYESELSTFRKKGFTEVLFLNSRGELTEGAISNIFIKKENIYFTPPLASGLLNGVYRQFLFESETLPLKEKVLYPEDLKNADEIYIANSVRKMTQVRLRCLK